MSLKEKLDGYRAASAGKIPPHVLAIMHRATEVLRKSGIMEQTLKAGGRLPEFSFPNADGTLVHSKDLLAKGPLVLSFYRGVW